MPEPSNVASVARGVFITFEGGEGTGKSTQIRMLADRLRTKGVDVVATREPGGSPGAEQVRELVLNGPPDRWSPRTETLLMYAARSDHLERTIAPALERGAWVVCDRFADSTRAYQGAAGNVAGRLIGALEAAVIGEDGPDLTLVLDLPIETGLERAAERGGAEARFEAKGSLFHSRLRDAFLQIASQEPHRCKVIDAAGTREAVAGRVWAAVEPLLAVR